MFILKLLLFIFILGIIILIHELGHFMWAKIFKVHIYEFSIGMGKVLYTHKGKDNINYNIRVFPIGGFVSMAGEVYEDTEEIAKEKLMCNKPWWQRLIILVAGVTNNFILAIILLMVYGGIWGGGPVKPIISDVLDNSAAFNAGLQSGDRILEINNYKTASWDKAQIIMYYKKSQDYTIFKVKHADGKTEEIKVTPEKVIDEETNKETLKYGIAIQNEDTKGFLKAIKFGFTKFAACIDSMVYTIFGLFSGKIGLGELSGPVGIYEVVGSAFSFSLSAAIAYVIYIIAFLSINVGFINILPFPAFDGGHVLFLIIEIIRRKKMDAKLENAFHIVGFALIFLLMIIVTINDIIKLF